MRNKLKLERVVVFGIVGLAAIAAVTFILTLLLPIDVLKNWTIRTDKDEYSIGDTVTVVSTFDKVMSVNGKATRYIECNNKGSWLRYSIAEANANRPQGVGTSQITIVIPDTVPNQDTKCRLYFESEYIVYSYRHFKEEAYSNEFHLKLSDKATTPVEPVSVVEESKDSILCSVLPGVEPQQLPRVENVPQPKPVIPVQPMPQPRKQNVTPPVEKEPVQPSILQQLLESIVNLIRIK